MMATQNEEKLLDALAILAISYKEASEELKRNDRLYKHEREERIKMEKLVSELRDKYEGKLNEVAKPKEQW